MQRARLFFAIFSWLGSAASGVSGQSHPAPLGIFENHGDLGTVLHPGTATFDAAKSAYTITGSGDNMWFGEDDFHFAWKKVSGDVAISADVVFAGEKGNNHRKAVLMIRQSLDGNSAAVDIARHGDGLTSLQFRAAAGDNTHEVQSNIAAPARVRLEKRGDFFYAFVTGKDGKLEPAGASTKLALTGPFYVGIGVSSHDKDATETAVFSNVKVETLTTTDKKPVLYSTLETVPIAYGDRRVAYVAATHFEAPNWSRDGSYFLFNQDGGIYRLPVSGGEPARITYRHTDAMQQRSRHFARRHYAGGQRFDGGEEIAWSTRFPLPAARRSRSRPTRHRIGMAGRRMDRLWPLQGSADGGTENFDIYTIPVAGGDEKRLTTAAGLDDGPEYSPDGQWIYFNSERTGSMQIWRMHADGSNQEQVITSETNDWFPHISPDGKWMVYLSYEKGVTGHPPNKDVKLNLMSMTDKKTRALATLFGGQGTINVPSWSPDSTKVAFVSYEYIADETRE